MKKSFKFLLPLFLCLALLLSGCGAAAADKMDSAGTDGNWNSSANSKPMEPEMAPEMDMGDVDMEESVTADSATGVSGLLEYPDAADNGDKIIYSAWAELETLAFEDSVRAVYAMIEANNGFIESSDVSGTDYSSQFYGYKNYRRANFTIRVPKENFSAMMNSLGEIGNVTYSSTQAENITSQFVDTESRLNMYKAEEDRLLTMLESAANVEEMILIESRLSEVRYNIESLTSQLNNWQKQVDYSTVTLSLYEVEELTREVPVQRTYWQQVGDSLQNVLEDLGQFFKDFLRILIAGLPVILLVGVIATVVLVILFKGRKRRKARKAKKQEKNGEEE